MIIKPFRGVFLRNIAISSIAIYQPISFFNFYIVDFKSNPKKYLNRIILMGYQQVLSINNNIHNVGKISFKKVKIRTIKIIYNIRV